MRFYVLDQSVMRKPLLAEIVRSESEVAFVVPDTAFVEMVKSERWEDTMRRSFAALASVPEKTFVSLSVPEVMRVERATQRRLDHTALFPTEFTDLIQQLIPALGPCSASSALDSIRARVIAIRTRLLSEEADAVREKAWIERLVPLVASACGPSIVKDLRNCRMGRSARLGLIRLKAPELFTGTFNGDAHQADIFRLSKPLLLRHVYLRLRHAIRWLKYGGLHGTKPTTLLNHRLDQEYVLIASYCDALLTHDVEARETYEDLIMLLDDTREEELVREFRGYLADVPSI